MCFLPARTLGIGATVCILGHRSVAVKLLQGALESLDRTPKPKKNMTRRCASRWLAELVAERAAASVVLWVFGVMRGINGKKNMTARHATHPPAVPMVELGFEGGSGWAFANGPLDGRGNQGSNPR